MSLCFFLSGHSHRINQFCTSIRVLTFFCERGRGGTGSGGRGLFSGDKEEKWKRNKNVKFG